MKPDYKTIEDYKIGDKFRISFTGGRASICRVTRKTKSLVILGKNHRFRVLPNGKLDCYGGGQWHRFSAQPLSDQEYAQIKAKWKKESLILRIIDMDMTNVPMHTLLVWEQTIIGSNENET